MTIKIQSIGQLKHVLEEYNDYLRKIVVDNYACGITLFNTTKKIHIHCKIHSQEPVFFFYTGKRRQKTLKITTK